jgi:hypothetical protein
MAKVNNTVKEKIVSPADIIRYLPLTQGNLSFFSMFTISNVKHNLCFVRSDTRKLGSQSKQRTEDDADANLASKIIRNKQYKTATQADDEYDYDDILDTRERQKKTNLKQQMGKNSPMKIQKRIITQQERCQLCFENPSRPKHLTISIANFTYLMLPSWEPVVAGHCYILPMQVQLSCS